MKDKHKIALTALATLGLLTIGTTAVNAKNVNSEHRIRLYNIDNPIHFIKQLSPNNILSQLNHVNREHHKFFNQPNRKLNNLHSHVKNINRHNKTHGHKKDHDQIHNQKHMDLDYDHIKMPSKPLRDNNHSNISNINHFIKIRRPYLYTAIGGNTRDLGGYLTSNHKYRTRVGKIIRSADLDGLSPAGLQDLQQLHVNKIIDLRYPNSKDGIEGHPDPNEAPDVKLSGTDIIYQYDPVYSYSEHNQFDNYMKDHDIHGEYYFYGAPSVNEPQAIKAYRLIFKDLLNNQHGAILFHCNLGRDRTGTTSALILSALGVSRNVIYHDYLLTDHYQYKYHNVQPYPKQAGELSYFFRTIDSRYGSVKNYLEGPLHLSNHDIHQLRSMYLVPNNRHYSVKMISTKAHKAHKDHKGHKVKSNYKSHKLTKKFSDAKILTKRGDHKVEKASNH